MVRIAAEGTSLRHAADSEYSVEFEELALEALRIVEREKSLPADVQTVQRRNLLRWLSVNAAVLDSEPVKSRQPI